MGEDGEKSRAFRRLIAGSLFRGVPFDQLFLHPFKNGIRCTFDGVIKNEGQPRDE